MKFKNLKRHSIVARIFFLLTITLLAQSVFSLYTIIVTDIATKVESYSYSTFTKTVINRKSNLESFMNTGWSNISETSSNISSIYNEVLGDSDYLTEEEQSVFLNNSVEAIVQMIAMTGTSGGFIILDDGEDMKYSYSTVYLKNYDNLNLAGSSVNLMLARGPTEVSKNHGFSLVSNWSYGITLTEETLPILSIPMEASKNTQSLEYLGYWHISTDITNDKLRVMTCSMPILDSNGDAIGVIGVEVSQEYLYKFLPENELGDEGSYGYILADIESGESNSINPIMMNGTNQSQLMNLEETIDVDTIEFTTHDLEVEPKLLQSHDVDVCIYYEPLTLYVNNSPYEEHVIWIAGMVDWNNMTSFTTYFWKSIFEMFLLSLLVGVFISYVVGLWVARPILKLRNVVSSYKGEQEMSFNKTNIIEIDELSGTIQQMQENILRSANRTDKILELLNIGVGSFEYVQDSPVVTISQAVYKMLELEEYEGKPIPTNIFFDTLYRLKSNPIKEVAKTYAVGRINVKYYKIEEFRQDDVLLGVIEDTTTDVEDLLVLNYERNYDVLTGIFNRRAFHKKVQDTLGDGDLKVAGFVMFDLDNLKYVNDTFGHDSGDVYIKTAATTISAMLHEYGVVGRMSGDEFYAFLHGFDSRDDLMDKLNKLYAEFDSVPIEMPNAVEFKIRVSGGISWYGDDSSDIDELQKYADFAMYKGKHTVKGELRQFDMDMYKEESFMLNGKAELNRVLDNELVNFAFQPIINVKTGEIHAYEALMRPDSEILATPLKLLQLAGLEGKLWKVERITLFKTLSLYKKYRDMFNDAKMFINSIPTENLKDEEYDEIKELYQDCLPNIVIEITEQQNDSFIDSKLESLHLLNLDIALDDYGSGYANDIGLIKIKPDIVKIDRSLISNVHVDPSRQAVVNKIISYCKEHGICVLGEGIETEQELDYLIEAGIELAQGYYISRPLELPNFNKEDIASKIKAKS